MSKSKCCPGSRYYGRNIWVIVTIKLMKYKIQKCSPKIRIPDNFSILDTLMYFCCQPKTNDICLLRRSWENFVRLLMFIQTFYVHLYIARFQTLDDIIFWIYNYFKVLCIIHCPFYTKSDLLIPGIPPWRGQPSLWWDIKNKVKQR